MGPSMSLPGFWTPADHSTSRTLNSPKHPLTYWLLTTGWKNIPSWKCHRGWNLFRLPKMAAWLGLRWSESCQDEVIGTWYSKPLPPLRVRDHRYPNSSLNLARLNWIHPFEASQLPVTCRGNVMPSIQARPRLQRPARHNGGRFARGGTQGLVWYRRAVCVWQECTSFSLAPNPWREVLTYCILQYMFVFPPNGI